MLLLEVTEECAKTRDEKRVEIPGSGGHPAGWVTRMQKSWASGTLAGRR